jgi:hypothetical protein
MIKNAGCEILGLGAPDRAYTVFERLYRQRACTWAPNPHCLAPGLTVRQRTQHLNTTSPHVQARVAKSTTWPHKPVLAYGVRACVGWRSLKHGGAKNLIQE